MRILVHVDDFACTFTSRELYNKVFGAMQKQFNITDYGAKPIERFLGICVEKTPDGKYRLHQQPYINEILCRLNMQDCKPAATPERVGTSAKLRPTGSLTTSEEKFMQKIPYREAVGALFYLCRGTRFDITHAVSEVARFMSNPSPQHWDAVLRIYRYLSRTKSTALVMQSSKLKCEITEQSLEGFSDSDWAGCPITRKSHTGWLVRVGGSLVAWYSKKQSTLAQSVTEAEYIAASALANEIIWWRRLLCDLGYDLTKPTKLWTDNRAAAILSKHECNFEAAKHIELRYHVLRDYHNRNLIQLEWKKSAKMWADILTKNCSQKLFLRVANQLLGEDLPPLNVRGGRTRV